MENKQAGTLRNVYLERYASQKQLCSKEPSNDLKLIVTIPCYNEESLIPCLESLANCDQPVEGSVEVLVLVNESEKDNKAVTERNQKCFDEAVNWINLNKTNRLTFYIFYEKLPSKHAGVGLARKMIMDEALKRFLYVENERGVIACYDADCYCDTDYLIEITRYFEDHPKCPGASIYFEHDTEGENSEAIIDYELFLRYYVNALRFSKFPYAYETIGSSMAVRAEAYQKQGGMNKRKAGEDFYFLHKIIPLGNFGEINTTRVLPSARVSDRVPFGTGKAVGQWIQNQKLETYSISTFEDLKIFIEKVPDLYEHDANELEYPESVAQYLKSTNGFESIMKVKNNSASYETFLKQFYQWFDGFNVLKYVHFARDNFYPNEPVAKVAAELLNKLYPELNSKSPQELLFAYRKLDRTQSKMF